MLNTTSPGVDIQTLRALEQLAFVVNDVEQRLHLVKTTLTQALSPPQGTQSPWGADRTIQPQVANVAQLLGGLNVPMGSPLGLGTQGIHSQPFAGFPPVVIPGVNAPLGITPGFQTPGYPFRFG